MTQHTSTQKYTKATVHLPPPTCPPAGFPLPCTQMPKPGPRYSELFLFPKSPPSILAKFHWFQLSPTSITLLDALPWVVNPPLPTQCQPPVTLLSSTLPHTPLHRVPSLEPLHTSQFHLKVTYSGMRKNSNSRYSLLWLACALVLKSVSAELLPPQRR